MYRLYDPSTPIPHDKAHILVLRNAMPSGIDAIVKQVNAIHVINGDGGLIVAETLNEYNKDISNKYLSLMLKFCSLIAKVDGNISEKEQKFINHINLFRNTSMNNHEKLQ